ncbi:MAG: hypothetical protein HYZ54_05575 [Ignavibacteriae bacterium]|nr:hypothetical protein [Ignavibacteriota bacterium]
MANTIKITACDNELILIAYQSGSSFELCRILSGYNNSVNISVNIYNGQFQGTLLLDGINPGNSLSGTYNIALAKGQYSLIGLGIDWGGPQAFAFSLNGSAAGFIATGGADGLVSYTKPIVLTV